MRIVLEALYDKWKSGVVTGDEKPEKPGFVCFNNLVGFLELLHHHICNRSNIIVHCDVDVDGIGCGYELKRFLEQLTPTPQSYVINKDKEHGIMERHVDVINRYGVDLLIIVDSSSNEIEIAKKLNCDVIIIDHHEILHNETYGYTNDGKHKFIIVNNMIKGSDPSVVNEWIRKVNPETIVKFSDYEPDSRMSCGLVIYELLRIYCEAYRHYHMVENLMLYQWAGVTLLTDAIPLLTERNQWYMENTVHSNVVEQTLQTMLTSLSRYNLRLTKSNISYSLAPTINKAIRAGASSEALRVVLNSPSSIANLLKYRENQDHAIAVGTTDVIEMDTFVEKDLSNTDISPNYCGVIASKLCDEYKKNAIVFVETDGVCQGSFRGRISGTDYRKQVEGFVDGNYAQGHKQAFGFKVKRDDLMPTMESLNSIEKEVSTRRYLTAGNLPESELGVYHISDFEAFKKAGGIIRLGIGNSKVSSDEQIMISVPSSLASLVSNEGKLFIYDVLGLRCKAFSEIEPGIINLYIEYTNSIDVFIK